MPARPPNVWAGGVCGSERLFTVLGLRVRVCVEYIRFRLACRVLCVVWDVRKSISSHATFVGCGCVFLRRFPRAIRAKFTDKSKCNHRVCVCVSTERERLDV